MQWLKLGVVDIQIAKKIIAENFAEDKDEREKAFSIYLTKPYQTIHDSPTIKYYTDWNLYDSLNINNISLQKVYRTEDKYLINIKDDDIIIGKDVNVDDNIKDGILNIDEHKLVSLSLSLSRRITIKESGQYYIKHTITKPNYFSPSHLIIEVPKDIEIKLIYEVSNFADNSLVSPLISINIEEGGKLDFQFINLSGNNSLLFSYIKANIKGKLDSSIFINGAKMAHVEFITKLWENSISNFSSRALGTYNNRIDIVNNVIHLGERSSSNGNMKAISNDQAFTVVRGTASINETAIDSSTSIIGRSLILGKEAKAVVSPMLEVKTGRVVMAKHSASITRIDENQIFYLQSRGFNKKEAEGLIIRGFIIEEQDPEGLKNKIEEILTSLGY
ncbi:MAG: SufD family Fe-S cluster assembly protein [Saccharolobus sp.]|uniref:SufD family Fe-S cluster assembly protein n=1 Tax=Saccharolobus sp. TaxID=2100761 RepID=UPI0028CF7180|nr:SufD family Fe-S cluster assembly protein [Saccharolobus sp.]MDT7861114.1 SufD family Fe-S cluster assembly protein [Saccharolobus sp.]